MNSPSVRVLLAACIAIGCSSSPLTGVPTAEGEQPSASAGSGGGGPVLGPTSTFAAYPAGPYGTTRGATIANLSFSGWKHPDEAGYDVSKFETVRLSDFYNPDGHSDVKVLAINASAVWCSVCRAEYQDMKATQVYAASRAKGVEILGALFEDVAYYPAQPQDLSNWGVSTKYDVKFPLVVDPGFKLGAYFDSDATPLNMLIDVRTMTIVQVTMGWSKTFWTDAQALSDKM